MFRRITIIIQTVLRVAKVSDLLREGQFQRAQEELDKTDPAVRKSMQYLMLKGSCHIGLKELGEADAAFLEAKESVKASSFREVDKKYLCLYADFMRAYIRDKSGRGPRLEKMRRQAKELAPNIKPRYLRDFPIV